MCEIIEWIRMRTRLVQGKHVAELHIALRARMCIMHPIPQSSHKQPSWPISRNVSHCDRVSKSNPINIPFRSLCQIFANRKQQGKQCTPTMTATLAKLIATLCLIRPHLIQFENQSDEDKPVRQMTRYKYSGHETMPGLHNAT